MAQRDWRSEFEAVEGKAHELVEALETLQSEASAYRDHNRTIEGGAKSLAKVAKSFDELLPRVDEAMRTMNKLGTPDLHQEVEALGRRLADLEESVKASSQRVIAFLLGLIGLSVVLAIGLGVLLLRG